MSLVLIYGCACVIIHKRAHLCTCVTVLLPNTDGSLHISKFLELIVFPQVLIITGKGDVGANEPEDKTMKVMCQLKNC